jgi:hypothetical protein
MAYVCKYVQDDASYTPYVEAMYTTLSGAGWELHDAVSSTNKVFKSKGENGVYCYGYIQASLESTFYIVLRMFQDWNSATHVGIAGTYYSAADARMVINTYKPVVMYCNKDFFLIWCTTATPADACVSVVGVLSEVYDTTLTTTTSGVSSGSSVTVPVVSSDGFLKGARYKLVGINLEGREVVTVSSITNSTNLVVSSLTYNYSSGAYIGKEPCPIFTQSAVSGPSLYYGFGYNSGYSTVDGTGKQTNPSTRLIPLDMLVNTYLDPEPTYNLYGLCPTHFVEYSLYSYIGYFNNLFKPPIYAASNTAYDGIFMNGDLYTTKAQPILTVISGTVTNTITLGAVSWDTNELQNKIVIIAIGNSAGHTRKIISNTSDTITVGVNWGITIDVDDSVIVCDEVYRPIASVCAKEVII